MKNKSLNKEQRFLDNDCIFLEMKCEVKYLVLPWKILARSMTNHANDMFGARAVMVPFKKGNI